MRMISVLLAATAMIATDATAQTTPPGEAVPQAGVDRLEQLLWEGAARKNTADAYETYLRRYPAGPHAAAARETADRLAGEQPEPAAAAVAPPAPAVTEAAPPPAAPAPAAPAPPVASGSPLFLCRPVFPNGRPPFESAGETEIAAYLQALKVNSVVAYKAYLQAYPRGVFAPAVTELVTTREGRAAALAGTTVPGPRLAHARAPVTITAADMPEGAPSSGSATAIWEVGEDGCVQSCRIEASSGSSVLDAATCRILAARGQYDPARDAAGKPIRSIETATFPWPPAAR